MVIGSASFHLSLIRPAGYLHSSCFLEVFEALYEALTQLGHHVTGGENCVELTAINIILGAHLLQEDAAMQLPPHTVIYNLEQLGMDWLPGWYLSLAERHQIWDYSAANVARWMGARCLHTPSVLQVAYMPVLHRIPTATAQNIDILFYGSLDDRRLELLKQIEADGLKLQFVFGIYGAQRDEMISRSKLVLNVHSRADGLFEIVRVSYLLANAKAVVTENSPDIGDLARAVAVAHRDDLANTCRDLLQNDAKRHQLEQQGFAMFSATSLTHSLREALRALA